MRFYPRFFHRDEPTEDLYIAVLLWGKEHLGEPTTPSDLFKVMNDRGVESPYLSSIEKFELLFWHSFEALEPHHQQREAHKWVLSVDSYFRLLEYEELHEARQSSRRALTVAIIAVAISGALATASIVINV